MLCKQIICCIKRWNKAIIKKKCWKCLVLFYFLDARVKSVHMAGHREKQNKNKGNNDFLALVYIVKMPTEHEYLWNKGRNLYCSMIHNLSVAAAKHKPIERLMKGSCCLMRWGYHLNYSNMSPYTPLNKTLIVLASNKITKEHGIEKVFGSSQKSFPLEQVIKKYCFTIKGSVTSTYNKPWSIHEGRVREKK